MGISLRRILYFLLLYLVQRLQMQGGAIDHYRHSISNTIRRRHIALLDQYGRPRAVSGFNPADTRQPKYVNIYQKNYCYLFIYFHNPTQLFI